MIPHRECNVCGRPLAEDTVGRICFICADKIRRDMPIEGELHYTVKDLRILLGYQCEESVRRLGRQEVIPGRVPGTTRHLYFKKDVDVWLASGALRPPVEPSVKKPSNPVQEEAFALCRKGDHSWFEDDRFAGQAYRTETVSHSQTGYVVTVGHRKRCYFCRYVEE